MVRKIILIILFTTIAFGQTVPNKKLLQSRPLTANLTWGGASPWTYSKYYLNIFPMTSWDTANFKIGRTLAGTKADSIYWVLTNDFGNGCPWTVDGVKSRIVYNNEYSNNDGIGHMIPLPHEWQLHVASGGQSIPYLVERYANVTDWRTSSTMVDGRTYYDWLADTLLYWCNRNWVDGYSSDGTARLPYLTYLYDNEDIDQNGIADMSDPNLGATITQRERWVRNQYADAINKFATRLRAKPEWGNRVLMYWTIKDSMGMRLFNGQGWENGPQNPPLAFGYPDGLTTCDGYTSWGQITEDWNNNSPTPSMGHFAATFWSVYTLPTCPTPYTQRGKAYYKYMRWTLGMAMWEDAYYSIQLAPIDANGDHISNYRYDEFNTKLGFPKATIGIGNGRYSLNYGALKIMFFDNGVMIFFNPSRASGLTSITVDTTTLKQFNEYNPTGYYYFYGNQDTARNSGKQFTSITLTVDPTSFAGTGFRWSSEQLGDMVILKTFPDTCIEDIIVDNAPLMTSPGSNSATVTSGITYSATDNYRDTLDGIYPPFNCNNSFRTGGYPYGSTPNVDGYCNLRMPATGTETATFTPEIRRAGRWELYGWWGKLRNITLASNLPVRINYAGGYKDTTINQRLSSGQWNYFGTYDYTPDGNKSVVMSNTGINGIGCIDAWRWHFVTYTTVADSSPLVTTNTATVVGKDTAILNGTITPRGYDVTVWVEYGTSPTLATYTSADSQIVAGYLGATSVHSHLRNLTSNTTYYYRYCGTNVKGTRRGEIVGFTTLLSSQSILKLKLLERND